MLRILLVESALMLVPKTYRDHPTVRNWCKRFGRKPHEAVLDVNYHYQILKQLGSPGRLGRPDIVHFTLLYALESPLAKTGGVEAYVHTVEDKIFYVEGDTKLPRGYSRFIGILSQVLRGIDTPKVHPLNTDVVELVEQWKREGFRVLLLDEGGAPLSEEDVAAEKLAVIVGGFAEGSFTREYPHDKRVSVWREPLNTWNVVGEVIASRERALGLL